MQSAIGDISKRRRAESFLVNIPGTREMGEKWDKNGFVIYKRLGSARLVPRRMFRMDNLDRSNRSGQIKWQTG